MAVPDQVQSYLVRIGQAFEQRNVDPQLLVQAIRLDEKGVHDAVRAGLQEAKQSGIAIETLVLQYARIPDSERLHALVVSILEYNAQHECVYGLTHGKGKGKSFHVGTTTSTYVDAYASWAQVFSRASLVFQAQDSPFFGPTLRYIGVTLVLLAIAADEASGNLAQPSITDAVSRISRTTGIAAIDRTPLPGQQTKRSEVLWLANASFRCYFKLNNIRLCETVLGSVENALTLNRSFASAEQKNSAQGDEATMGMACYTRADKVAYRYYLGRLRLSQQRIRSAYDELRWSFDHCTNAHMHNKTLILVHLTVAAIILGIYPSHALLHATGLTGPFGKLLSCIQAGDGYGMYAELDKWRTWHSHHGHYLLLREKLEIGVWRNLLRRSFLIARLLSGLGPPVVQSNGGGAPAAASSTTTKTPPPVLKLGAFLTLARVAWQDDQLTMDDVECVVASLIDQGYVKAYAMHSSGNIVFRRTADFGFVKMSTVY